MDCDLAVRHADEALEWAKRSAEIGTKDDAYVYEGLLEAHRPK